jgi:sugar lactone lactonase YvrE
LWIDIVRGKLFSFDPKTGSNRDVHMKQLLGTVVPVDKERCVVAGVKGVCVVNQLTGEPKEFLGPNPEADSFSLRWNDGKCDPQGRLWLGSMDMQFGEAWLQNPDGSTKKPAGLYCWEGSGDSLKITKKLSDVMISNGLVWNKAGDTFYYTDTPTYQVDAFDFDGKTGEISNRRCAIKVPDDTSPDVRTINQAPSYRTIHFAMMTHSCFALLNT